MKRFYPFLFLLFAVSTISFLSCKKDVEGCSDPLADNYNAEATVNTDCKYSGCTDSAAENYNPNANVSTTCIYARDKFIGSYTGQLMCPGNLAFISGSTTFTIDENITGDKSEINILLTTNTGLLIPIVGKCIGDKVTINTTLENVSITLGGTPREVTIVAVGEATYTESTKILTGPLKITVSNPPLINFTDDCTMSGVKQ